MSIGTAPEPIPTREPADVSDLSDRELLELVARQQSQVLAIAEQLGAAVVEFGTMAEQLTAGGPAGILRLLSGRPPKGAPEAIPVD